MPAAFYAAGALGQRKGGSQREGNKAEMITPVFSGDDVLALSLAPAPAFFHAHFSGAQAEGKFAHP
jgi:hypothetical protein